MDVEVLHAHNTLWRSARRWDTHHRIICRPDHLHPAPHLHPFTCYTVDPAHLESVECTVCVRAFSIDVCVHVCDVSIDVSVHVCVHLVCV